MITYEVKYFRLNEFKCPCCGVGKPSVMLVLWLDQLRKAFNFPIRVNSGYRCEKHNIEVGGAQKSRHLLGCAADIAPVFPTGSKTKEWQTFLKERMFDFQAMALELFSNNGWEVKQHPTFMHVAVPRDEAGRLWSGEKILV